MVILKENQDTLSSQIQQTFNFVNLTYVGNQHQLPDPKVITERHLQVNSTIHIL